MFVTLDVENLYLLFIHSPLVHSLTHSHSLSACSTRFVVTIDGASDKYKNLTADEESPSQEQVDIDDDGGGSRALGERCRFWPNCKNGDTCPYHHPTIPCR